MIALDPAASEFYDGANMFSKNRTNANYRDEMIAYWTDWTEKYPIISIEDGLAENDWDRLEKNYPKNRQKNPARRRRSICHETRFLQKGIDSARQIRF